MIRLVFALQRRYSGGERGTSNGQKSDDRTEETNAEGTTALICSLGAEGLLPETLTAQSRARAEEAQSDGTLFLLGDLTCECGERVGAQETPTGGLVPTPHYPYKAPRVARKRGPYKRISR